jgi:uncharacterized iron-regulated protein
LALAACLALGGCSQTLLLEDHPLAGRIWDAHVGTFVSQADLLARLPAARHVILGETHDNPRHHELQRRVLDSLAPAGRRTLAMEQFDSEYQHALDAATTRRANAEVLADAGRLDRKGWDWPRYKPLVEFALDHDWPIAAANLSRVEARRILADPSITGLAPAPPALRAALERDLVEGHCGSQPDTKRLAAMVETQRARDARMAAALKGPSVLITGNGHARRDRGVPLYIKDGGSVLSIAFMEVEDGKNEPHAYFDGFASAASFDYIWFTPRAVRRDPCL